MPNTTKPSMRWLRNRMDDLGYTSLEQVAQAMGINRGNLYRYFTLETAPSIHMVPVMCRALQCTYDELFQALKVTTKSQSYAA